MNNGTLPNSSNSAVRYNPVTQNLIIGDADAARSANAQSLITIGQNNSVLGLNDRNLIIGSGHQIFGGVGQYGQSTKNIIIGNDHSLYANTLSTLDGNLILLGNNITAGNPVSGFKNYTVAIGNNFTIGTVTDGVMIGRGVIGAQNAVSIGLNPSASGSGAIAIGQSAAAGNQGCIALGISASTGSGYNSIAVGTSTSRMNSAFTIGPGALTAPAGNQVEIIQLAVLSTDANYQEATAWTVGAQRLPIQNNQLIAFRGTATARNTNDITKCKMFTFDGAIRKATTAASTTLVGTPTITSVGDTGTENYNISVTADTTNGALAVYVTSGAASTNVRWLIRIDTTENM